MGGSIGRIAAAVATGGTSEIARPIAKATGVPSEAINPIGAATQAGEQKGLDTLGIGGKSNNSPAVPINGPVAPSMQDVAKQAQLDEQKRLSMTSPSDTTNVGGARGILTDPNAKYVTGKLLGGA